MTDQSSQDQRARTGADTQRMVYARELLQVRRVERTTTSMYCNTTVSKLLARSTSDRYIWCLLPQPFVPACPMLCACLCERSVCACLPYLLCLHRFEFSDFCVQSVRWACTRASKRVHACALLLYDIKGGCARALLSMWMHAYFFFAICNKHWVLISFGDIRLSAYPWSCGYTLTLPPPHTSPTTLGPTIPRVLFPSSRPLGGDSLPQSAVAELMIGTRQRLLCLTACSLFPAPCAAKPSHMASHTLISVVSMSQHDPVDYLVTLVDDSTKVHTPATAMEDSPSQPPHALAKYTKEPWMYPSPPLTKESSFVGRA